MSSQKSPILCAIRWTLIAGLTVLLLAMGIDVSIVLLKIVLSGEEYTWLRLIPLVILFSCCLAFPAVMLWSLVNRRLKGLASCLGVALAITLFSLGWYLPQKAHLFEQLIAAPLPGIVKALVGIPLAIGLFILPFYAAGWAMRFTERWLYPRVFQPMESRI